MRFQRRRIFCWDCRSTNSQHCPKYTALLHFDTSYSIRSNIRQRFSTKLCPNCSIAVILQYIVGMRYNVSNKWTFGIRLDALNAKYRGDQSTPQHFWKILRSNEIFSSETNETRGWSNKNIHSIKSRKKF